MTLKELADEYRESALRLQKREEFIKRQVKTGALEDSLDTQTRLKYLREERYDALNVANYLENYYSHRQVNDNA